MGIDNYRSGKIKKRKGFLNTRSSKIKNIQVYVSQIMKVRGMKKRKWEVQTREEKTLSYEITANPGKKKLPKLKIAERNTNQGKENKTQ